ncbi:hypothetical protein DVK85_06895 [Flavobacterium arcticum]|uniref:Uncharacterized protein n=1 Tax=Flavobacterium arcticum TaxID=1784713 RepID=A0A345HBM4_9FLAO|nr:hypothetical protein [Flavobacterium arcticum]AXG73984.1 hypothetical protein DVK85_06895 [Flavobacterium arcticum]KAF2508962.1 hypothetical protein E0W72_10380 [Flavobacterium arcticum]
MTTIDFAVDDTHVTLYNSIAGKETITVNGKTVSEKHSFFGTRHEFTFEDDTYEVITAMQCWQTIGVKVQLRKNGKLIEEKTEGQSMLALLVGTLILVLLLQFLVG